ncbi:Hypothetical protein, putative [Bodo saltans]|uniref:Uncharacterized protein n=1 Tax=Bodo saltans TaxID=75058 RepID=A0A0S4JVX9_BODSA|nr:Hypothetical protein, putative [Bodo saltans]|eukprot:CUG93610.1 Hypothetical protein, putative [Bodo saltans]
MIVCRLFIGVKKRLERLDVNSKAVFTLVEDGPTRPSSSVVDVIWSRNKTGEYNIIAEFRHDFLAEPSDTVKQVWSTKITVVSLSEVPICLLEDNVYFVMREMQSVCLSHIVVLLEHLHYTWLQEFCRTGPTSPFNSLHVSNDEWWTALEFGPGCRGKLAEKFKRCHLVSHHAKKLEYPAESKLTAFEGGSTYFFIALFDEDCTTLRASSNEGGFTQLNVRNGHAVRGQLPVGSIKNCTFEITVDCKNECHTASFCSPPLLEPHPIKPGGAIIFFSSPNSILSYQNCNPGAVAENAKAAVATPPKPPTGKYLLEVTSMPKANAVVVPRRLLDSNNKLLFDEDDVVAPNLTTMEANMLADGEFQGLAFKAYCLWDPPQCCNFPVKLYFEYDKFDIRDKKLPARPGMTKLKITQHDIDANAPLRLSSTSTLTIMEIKDGDIDIKYQPYQYLLTTAESVVSSAGDNNTSPSNVIASNHVASIGQKKAYLLRQAALLANLRSYLKASFSQRAPSSTVPVRADASPVVVTRDDALILYITEKCKRSLAELQQLCQPPTKADGFLTEAQWVGCWATGVGSRVSILRNIARCLRDAHSAPCALLFLRYIIDDIRHFAEVSKFLCELRTLHYKILQKQCREGNYLTAANVLNMSLQEWRNCYRSGPGCRDAMAADVGACVDRRAFTKIGFADDTKTSVSGFLDNPVKRTAK